MIKNLTFSISILLFIFYTGCDKLGKDDANQDSRPNESNNKGNNDKQVDKNKNGDYDDFTENMKKLEEMMSGGETVEVVNFRKLKELLPEEIDDLKRTGFSGEKTNAFGIKVSKAEGEYKSEDNRQTIKITILDMGSMKGLAGMTAFAGRGQKLIKNQMMVLKGLSNIRDIKHMKNTIRNIRIEKYRYLLQKDLW